MIHSDSGVAENNCIFKTSFPRGAEETWVSLLTAAGFSAEDMRRWHVEFEQLAPDKHVRFLKFLAIPGR